MTYPPPLQKLIELLQRLPGIGPRQAARFAFFILRENGGFASSLAAALAEAGARVATCSRCYRTMERNGSGLCSFCTDARREAQTIAVVEKESDLQNIEKTGAFRGLYHVLHGVLDPMDQDSPKRIRLKEFHARLASVLEERGGAEVILATNPTTEGDLTALYIERILAPLAEKHPELKITRLGRGLSLGSELEYADEITVKNALQNRK